MKQGNFANGYNIQAMTENGFVLSSYVADSSADQNLLIPTIQRFKNLYNTEPKYLLADKGYSSEDNFTFCEQEAIDAYIPLHQELLDMSVYTYNKKQNTYTHKDGRIFHFKQHMKKRKKKHAKDPVSYKRTVYEYVNERTQKKKYLCVSHEWQRLARKHERKLATPEGKELYKRRMPDVEGVFGNIKHNLKFTTFLLRGLTGAMIEWNLISLAHNLKKMI